MERDADEARGHPGIPAGSGQGDEEGVPDGVHADPGGHPLGVSAVAGRGDGAAGGEDGESSSARTETMKVDFTRLPFEDEFRRAVRCEICGNEWLLSQERPVQGAFVKCHCGNEWRWPAWAHGFADGYRKAWAIRNEMEPPHLEVEWPENGGRSRIVHASEEKAVCKFKLKPGRL